MTIAVQCPQCSTRFQIPSELIGAELSCDCEAHFTASEFRLAPSDYEIAIAGAPIPARCTRMEWMSGIVQRVSAAFLLSILFVLTAIQAAFAITRSPEM